MKDIIYVGVVGQIAAGKGVLVKYLTEKLNFTSYSLSSIVHDELKKKGIRKFTRQTLQDMGDQLRRGYGDEILARRVMSHLNNRRGLIYQTHDDIRIIIEGIRNPAEIKFLKKNKNFILIGVKANREIRFKRLLSRGKEWDPKTYEDFLKIDRRDIGVGQNKSGQQVGKCLVYCDYILTNNESIKDLERKVGKLMNEILNLKRLKVK